MVAEPEAHRRTAVAVGAGAAAGGEIGRWEYSALSTPSADIVIYAYSPARTIRIVF